MGCALRQRLVDAVRTSLGRLLRLNPLPPLLWRLVGRRGGNVSEGVAGVDGHGQGVRWSASDVLRNRHRDWVLAGVERPRRKGWKGLTCEMGMQRDWLRIIIIIKVMIGLVNILTVRP